MSHFCILVGIMPQVQDRLRDQLTCSPLFYQCTTAAPTPFIELKSIVMILHKCFMLGLSLFPPRFPNYNSRKQVLKLVSTPKPPYFTSNHRALLGHRTSLTTSHNFPNRKSWNLPGSRRFPRAACKITKCRMVSYSSKTPYGMLPYTLG